jgi:hypothetical protein
MLAKQIMFCIKISSAIFDTAENYQTSFSGKAVITICRLGPNIQSYILLGQVCPAGRFYSDILLGATRA